MALSDPAARRYADAVFGIAHDTASHDRWLADLEDIAALFSEPTVNGFLVSTRVAQAEKEQVLDNALPDVQAQRLATSPNCSSASGGPIWPRRSLRHSVSASTVCAALPRQP